MVGEQGAEMTFKDDVHRLGCPDCVTKYGCRCGTPRTTDEPEPPGGAVSVCGDITRMSCRDVARDLFGILADGNEILSYWRGVNGYDAALAVYAAVCAPMLAYEADVSRQKAHTVLNEMERAGECVRWDGRYAVYSPEMSGRRSPMPRVWWVAR